MPKDQAEYHLKRCIDSGMWVPNAKEADVASGDTATGGAAEDDSDEDVYSSACEQVD